MSPVSSNLHFHGLTIPPLCHQDEVMRTSIQPGDPRFEYRFRVPANEPAHEVARPPPTKSPGRRPSPVHAPANAATP